MTKHRNLVSVEQLTQHNTKDNLWIAIDGNVYDMTEFAEEHPGGADSKLAGFLSLVAFLI
jgi:L-lactate dehydrogenase (cytochrome)